MTKKPELDTAYSLKSPEDNKRLYAKWAQTYDHEFADHMGYALPARVADTFVSVVGSGEIGRVLDVGAGTGLVGQRLAAHGLVRIDALDISVEMLTVAASKGCYNAMIEGDLMGCLPIAADTYDFIISAGTFTHGHVDAAALDELLRITKPGALFCLSINSAYFVPAGFEGAFEGLAGRIQNLELRPVQFYLEEVSGPHAKDHGVIALFRKSVI
ncbi:MAG: putative TPR repeat methyltransferase [Planktomarina sp.]|jgi:predicted TPR repeat methyltransferase